MALREYTSLGPKLIILMVLAGLFIGACSVTPQPTPSATPHPRTPTLTPLPTSTPTPPPLGTDANPLVLGIVSETDDPQALAAAKDAIKSVQDLTGFVMVAKSYQSYVLLLSDMAFGKVEVAFLPPLTYLYAHQKGFAEVGMLTNHFGVYQYGIRYYANVASKYTIFYDPANDRGTTDAATALKQFNGAQPCWVDPQSPSGYLAPLGYLAQNGYKVKSGAFLESPVGVIRALYITGVCDFGATFATTGDARTSPAVTKDLTDVMNRVVVIWQSDPVIPNLNLSFHPSVKLDMRQDLMFGFKDLVKDQKGRSIISIANNYEIVDLKNIDESVYQPLEDLVRVTTFDLLPLVGR
ncbi:MAG TPA: PhnD/SsuA/transferrin family substrate-binding protein [Anaerolineaceae bacterium]|nr:PhnD/SsuA/transferrin family substrate-binding protein [Anaerolineaceae bacterium]